MRYCIHLFTKELPDTDQIEEILAPYYAGTVYSDEEDAPAVYPAFVWDYFIIGGRYGGALKLRVQIEEDDDYRWRFYAKDGEHREGRLFYSSLLKAIREKFKDFYGREENWLNYMGDGSFIYVDGARIKDLIDPEEAGCFGFVDIDGTAYSREQWDASAKAYIKHDDFDERYQETLKARSDCFLTVLDIHD